MADFLPVKKYIPISKGEDHAKYPIKKKNHLNQNKYIPDSYKKVAKDMESQFLNLMLKKMQDTVGKASPVSSSTDYYQSLLTTERSKAMAQKNDGLGIQKLILDQLYPKRFRNKIAYENYLKMMARKNIYNKNKIAMRPAENNNIRMKSSESQKFSVKATLEALKKDLLNE